MLQFPAKRSKEVVLRIAKKLLMKRNLLILSAAGLAMTVCATQDDDTVIVQTVTEGEMTSEEAQRLVNGK
jgi:polyhydroxyalkanoate synthesis regulator phasin